MNEAVSVTERGVRPHQVSLGESTRVWAKIAALSFGGPVGQIAMMHRILVEEKRWIGEERFLHALNYCMLLPGPEAQQLATYIGWLMHKTKGGLIAGGLFILPGFLAIMALSWLYVAFADLGAVEALFFGLKAAVVAIVFDAVRRIGGRALKTNAARLIAIAAFLAIFAFSVPFPVIILAAALIGFVAGHTGSKSFAANSGHGPAVGQVHDVDTLLGEGIPEHARPNFRWSLRIGGIFLLLWLLPVGLLLGMLGPDNVFSQIATFFSKMAVVTFGGAYAVLAYVAQQAVENFRWLSAGEMLDGLGLAETTPGPLIMVTQFVGFLAAFRQSTGLHPMVAATLGGILTTWVTFVPCFLWIFLGAPFVERLRENRGLATALSAITAAVVGVVLDLAVWFAIHYLFRSQEERLVGPVRLDAPVLNSVDVLAVLLSIAAIFLVFRLRVGVLPVLGGCAVAGVLFRGVLAL